MVRKFHLSIVLTNKCNLNCIYCYEKGKSNRSISVNVVKEIVSEYLNSPNYDEVEIDFFGGEPFLEFEKIKKICEWVWSNKWKNKYLFFATTNGVLVHGEIQEWLRKNKKYFWVCLSLDGMPESHNKNRNNSYDKIDIPFFKECWPKQTVKMTISKETVGSIFDNIIHIHSMGFDITGTNFAEGINWEDDKFTAIVTDQLEKLCRYYIAHPEIKPVPLLNMAIHKCEEKKTKRKWCGCGEFMAAYETDGKKYPCTFFSPMTFERNTLNEIMKMDFTCPSNFIDMECFEKCYLEPVCNCCYGANLMINGVVNRRDRSKCKLMQIRAVFSAALKAHYLQNHAEGTHENKLTLKAIRKINELYNK